MSWLAAAACAAALASHACSRSAIPAELDNREFQTLIDAFSEAPGPFTLSDNLVSNEPRFADRIRWLSPTGGAYIGVGPEQNFSYIAVLRPSIAFIVDIRRENLALHLFYKALFELSTDRADFVSRVFSRPRPAALPSTATVDEIFASYDSVPVSPALLATNAALVRERLLVVRGLSLSAADLDWMDHVLETFAANGPAIDYYRASRVDAVRPSYRELMTARDVTGRHRSFLATDRAFTFIKELQTRNLIVPVVGDFGGPTALRRVGDYVRQHAGHVRAVYASNVGVYLTNQQRYAFCGNLAALPAPPRAWFIESDGMQTLGARLRVCSAEGK